MAGLKIYACSGIGKTEDIRYWSDNTDIAANTQAVNTLLSLINLTYAEATCLRIPESEKIEKLNKIDLYTVCLQAVYKYKDDPVELHHAGEVIGTMVHNGAFNYNSLNLKKRDTHLDVLLDAADGAMESDIELVTDAAFMQWYFDNVEVRNKVGLTKAEQKRGQEALNEIAVSGIGEADGWEKDASISEYLLNASDYFLYIFLTDEQLKGLSYMITAKRRTQYSIYDFCKSVFTKLYGSEDAMLNIIRTGIIQESGDTPENLCAQLCEIEAKDKGIGFSWGIFIAVLVAIAPIIGYLVDLITGVLTYCQRVKEARYEALNDEIIAGGAPSTDDLENQKIIEEYKAEQRMAQVKKWFAPIAIGLAGLYLIFKK